MPEELKQWIKNTGAWANIKITEEDIEDFKAMKLDEKTLRELGIPEEIIIRVLK